jgi:hypothetical protein
MINLMLRASGSGKPLTKIKGIVSIWKTARAAERRLGVTETTITTTYPHRAERGNPKVLHVRVA